MMDHSEKNQGGHEGYSQKKEGLKKARELRSTGGNEVNMKTEGVVFSQPTEGSSYASKSNIVGVSNNNNVNINILCKDEQERLHNHKLYSNKNK